MSESFPLTNIRQSIDKQWEQVLINETIVVPSGGVVKLKEVPDDGSVNTKPVIPGLSETINYPPSAGQFYINYCTGYIEFNQNDVGNSYSVEYWAKGSLVESSDINYLNEKYVISSTAPSGYYGQQWYNTTNGITYTYDIRDKWLSQNRNFFVFGRQGLTNNQYLNFYAGNLPSNSSGLRLIRDACITGLVGQIKSIATCSFYIRKNKNITNLVQLDILSDYGSESNNINIDLSKGDTLHCYFDSVISTGKDPMMIVELAWK